MGFLKWFNSKRDILTTPSSISSLKEKPQSKKKNKLSRNGSYLKALSKFIKWRQVHLSSKTTRKNILFKSTPNNTKINNECIKINNERINNHEDLNCAQIIFEEVCVNSKNLKDNPQFLKNNKICLKYDSNLSRMSSGYSCVNDLILNRRFDEYEYALPLNYHDNEFGVPMCKNNSQKSFEFTNKNSHCNALKEALRRPMLVTDLDKSEGTIVSLNEDLNKIELCWNPIINLQPDLMIRSLEQIKYNEDFGFNTLNGYINHAEIDSTEISLLQMQDYCSNGIYNSFNILRKLRHPNIVLLMGVTIDKLSVLDGLLLEPTMNTLFGSIHLEKNRISIENCCKYAVQITNAISYLHKHHYIHSNICSQNIMMSKDTGIVKLGGFELCIFSKDDKNHNALHLPKQLYTEYRRKYTKYIYQASELLSGTKPSFYSDIYGVCITLWEMLSCEIPFQLLDYQELKEAFSLKKTQLPVYETERYAPFKNILLKGLEIHSENRFSNSVELKNAFLEVKLPTKSLPTVIDGTKLNYSLDKCGSGSFNIDIKTNEIHSRRTSTIKKQNSLKFNRSQTKICNWINFNKTCSPISAEPPLNWNIVDSSSTKFTESIANIRDTNDHQITPNKIFNVNIMIRPKCSPNSHLQNVNIFEKNLNELITRSNVKEKINKFESFSSSPSSINRSGFSDVVHSNNLNTKEKGCRNICIDYGIDKLQNEGKMSSEKYNLVQTEDFYIDDDILNDRVLGVNFELNCQRLI